MKLTIALAFTLSLFTTSVVVLASSSEVSPVHVLPSKEKNLFVFNINKSWRGAELEVIAAKGECISRQKLTRRKMIIDFCKVKAGQYTIKVSKGNQVQEFQYAKN
jgi:hypothetical protein